MFSNITVNGNGANPLWKFMKDQKVGPLNESHIDCNWTKFLINQYGEVSDRFEYYVKPEIFEHKIKFLLGIP